MSALGEALKGVKQLLLIQKQVEDLEQASEVQADALRDLARDVIGIDKRVVRIETMVEMTRGASTPPASQLSSK